ncbi:hypothetical protein [Aneurinibacillus tyrosinisolvens]|uniref:hypothetical protein n=1 Tax=Aneurinibacillus tyrosinisolvens TaxID=1443435 RepID=UPI00063F9F06|nr:hypothetical protein [Aneurinibacillus tyrosinisolvens]
MDSSFKEAKAIPHEELQKRLEETKELLVKENERYAIVKDSETGEHYVRYTLRHLNLLEGGVEEVYDHLLPIETDDVIAVALGEQEYEYPKHWNQMYLRGSDGEPYLWFDPSGVGEGIDDERAGRELSSMLDDFKKDKKFDEDSIRSLFKRIDDMLDGENK